MTRSGTFTKSQMQSLFDTKAMMYKGTVLLFSVTTVDELRQIVRKEKLTRPHMRITGPKAFLWNQIENLAQWNDFYTLASIEEQIGQVLIWNDTAYVFKTATVNILKQYLAYNNLGTSGLKPALFERAYNHSSKRNASRTPRAYSSPVKQRTRAKQPRMNPERELVGRAYKHNPMETFSPIPHTYSSPVKQRTKVKQLRMGPERTTRVKAYNHSHMETFSPVPHTYSSPVKQRTRAKQPRMSPERNTRVKEFSSKKMHSVTMSKQDHMTYYESRTSILERETLFSHHQSSVVSSSPRAYSPPAITKQPPRMRPEINARVKEFSTEQLHSILLSDFIVLDEDTVLLYSTISLQEILAKLRERRVAKRFSSKRDAWIVLQIFEELDIYFTLSSLKSALGCDLAWQNQKLVVANKFSEKITEFSC